MKKIKMIIEKTDTGFSAYSKKHPVFTTGSSVEELINNTYEAIELYLEEEDENITHETISFEIDFKQFFQYYNILNAKTLAKKIGMNPTLLSQYVQGHKKPSKAQTEKIINGIHLIGQELSDIKLIYNKS